MSRRGAPAGQIFAIVVSVLMLATMAAWAVYAVRKPKSQSSSLIIGENDTVYFFKPVTASDAASVGQALQTTGFFQNKGSAVQVMKFKGATTVSFALNDGAWNRPLTITAFEEIGRRIAPVIGGYPIQVNLSDDRWIAHRTLTVGKLTAGVNDTIYYFGKATDFEAQALAHALQNAGYLKDLGVTVTLAKDPYPVIGFVVNDSVWQNPDLAQRFAHLGEKVEGAVGGGPIQVRLLNGNMNEKKVMDVK